MKKKNFFRVPVFSCMCKEFWECFMKFGIRIRCGICQVSWNVFDGWETAQQPHSFSQTIISHLKQNKISSCPHNMYQIQQHSLKIVNIKTLPNFETHVCAHIKLHRSSIQLFVKWKSINASNDGWQCTRYTGRKPHSKHVIPSKPNWLMKYASLHGVLLHT